MLGPARHRAGRMPFLHRDPQTSRSLPFRATHVETCRFRRSPSPARRSHSEISDPGAAAWVLAVGLALLLGEPLAAADKVDVIHLKNGDRLTCEIQRLDRSVLSISTD